MSGKQRFRLVSDNDGHKYAIPADRLDAFYRWVESFDTDGIPSGLEEDFEVYRLGCSITRYSFTDFREDR